MGSGAVGRGMNDADVASAGMLSLLVLQHYFLDVYLTIMALPSASDIAAS